MDIRQGFFKRFFGHLTDFQTVSIFFIIYLIIASLFKYFTNNGAPGVFPIYREAFFNLMAHKDIYLQNSNPDIDYFLYTPTCAFLLAPFALIPVILGSLLWNLCSLIPMLLALKLMVLSKLQKAAVLWLIFMPAMNCVQHFQANLLVAALILLSFALFEKDKPVLAAICIALGFYVKIYALGFAILFLFYPHKIKFLAAFTLSLLFFLFLPLAAIPSDYLVFLYKRWLIALQLDTSCNLNFMGVMKGLFGLYLFKDITVQAFSMIFLLLPLLRIKSFAALNFRFYYLALLMTWVVIFSHKAESPTYIIALSGIALWFVLQKEFTTFKVFLLLFLLIFTYFSTTDLFPRLFRKYFLFPCGIKALPCCVIFFVIFYELMTTRFNNKEQAP